MLSPSALTLVHLRRSGYLADVAEKWVPHANRRRDLFGFIDIIGLDRREPGILAVQCTSLAHVADRLAKARGRPELAAWLRAGGRFEVWGWCKRGKHWRVKIVAVRPEDLMDVVITAPARRRRRHHQGSFFD
jgi:hypothetical protein